MTHEEHEAIVANILSNLTDQGLVSEALNSLREDYTETLATVGNLSSEKDTLTSHNESLRNVNNKMMLKLGDFSDTIVNQKPIIKDEAKVEEPLKFENLLNEEGELI